MARFRRPAGPGRPAGPAPRTGARHRESRGPGFLAGATLLRVGWTESREIGAPVTEDQTTWTASGELLTAGTDSRPWGPLLVSTRVVAGRFLLNTSQSVPTVSAWLAATSSSRCGGTPTMCGSSGPEHSSGSRSRSTSGTRARPEASDSQQLAACPQPSRAWDTDGRLPNSSRSRPGDSEWDQLRLSDDDRYLLIRAEWGAQSYDMAEMRVIGGSWPSTPSASESPQPIGRPSA